MVGLFRDMGTSVELRFTSPTTFRRKGLSVPLPDPSLIYGSLWQKWQAFSGVSVDAQVFEEMLDTIALASGWTLTPERGSTPGS